MNPNDADRAKNDRDAKAEAERKGGKQGTGVDHGSPGDAEQDEQKPGDAAKKEQRQRSASS